MMASDDWQIVFYARANDERPVEDFLDGLDQKTRARFLWSLEQLRLRNVQAREPLVKHLGGRIWELRRESDTNIYRLLSAVLRGRRIVLLHGFQKKTRKTPRREIELAQQRLEDVLRREGWGRTMKNERSAPTSPLEEGARAYARWRDTLLADPEFRVVYEEEAATSELWLQLVEARQTAGLTQDQLAQRLGVSQAQVARIEKRGYDAYTLTTLRRYVQALGEGFELTVSVRQRPPPPRCPRDLLR